MNFVQCCLQIRVCPGTHARLALLKERSRFLKAILARLWDPDECDEKTSQIDFCQRPELHYACERGIQEAATVDQALPVIERYSQKRRKKVMHQELAIDIIFSRRPLPTINRLRRMRCELPGISKVESKPAIANRILSRVE